jgi:molybdopterin molybdotransferase
LRVAEVTGFRAHVHTSFDQARETAFGWAPLPVEQVGLEASLGRTLAEPLQSHTDLPAFRTSSMDGWAVAGDRPWQVQQGRVLAGGTPAPLRPGQAVEIATGAMVPTGSEAVLRRENGALDGSELTGALSDTGDVLPIGGECRAGDVLLPAGTVITPPVLGLAASTGHDVLRVFRRPTVAVAVLGDELLTKGLPGEGRVRDSLGPQLAGWIAGLGGELVGLARVPDELADTVAAFGIDADVVVSTGGTAAGPVDYVHRALQAMGAEVLLDGVAVRPGHPMVLARLADGRPFVGLPGNPLSACVSVLTLLGPVLDALQGRSSRALPTVVLAAALTGRAPDVRLVPVAVGEAGATPVPHIGSAMLRGFTLAEGIAVIPPEGAAEGASVRLLRLPW